MEVNIYEIKVKVYLLQDIHVKDSLEKIASFIDMSLNKTEKLQELHTKNSFKNYCFSGLYSDEIGIKVLKADNNYSFCIRTVDKELAKHFKRELPKTESTHIKGLVASESVIYKRFIEKIDSLTPALANMKNSNRYWRNSHSVEDFISILNVNIIRKYNSFTNSDIDEDEIIFEKVEFVKEKPFVVNYKGKRFLTDKLNLKLANSPIAQDIGYFSLGTGILHANARGFGFCNYKFYKEGVS